MLPQGQKEEDFWTGLGLDINLKTHIPPPAFFPLFHLLNYSDTSDAAKEKHLNLTLELFLEVRV